MTGVQTCALPIFPLVHRNDKRPLNPGRIAVFRPHKINKAADLHPELFHGGRVPGIGRHENHKAIGLLDERAQIADFPGSGFIFAHDFRKMPVIIRYAQIHIIGIFADFAYQQLGNLQFKILNLL